VFVFCSIYFWSFASSWFLWLTRLFAVCGLVTCVLADHAPLFSKRNRSNPGLFAASILDRQGELSREREKKLNAGELLSEEPPGRVHG